MNIPQLVEEVFSTILFDTNVLKGSYHPGTSDLIIVTGDNASGKSILRRLIVMILQDQKIEGIHLSLEKRCEGGIERAFVYGSEQDEASGSITAHGILGAIKTSHGRDQKHAVIWDEPELGLSSNYQAGAGLKIRDFVINKPAHLECVVIITHSRTLVAQLMDIKPHHISLGSNLTLEEWFYSPIVPQPIEEIGEKNIETWRKIHQELEKRKKKNK